MVNNVFFLKGVQREEKKMSKEIIDKKKEERFWSNTKQKAKSKKKKTCAHYHFTYTRGGIPVFVNNNDNHNYTLICPYTYIVGGADADSIIQPINGKVLNLL